MPNRNRFVSVARLAQRKRGRGKGGVYVRFESVDTPGEWGPWQQRGEPIEGDPPPGSVCITFHYVDTPLFGLGKALSHLPTRAELTETVPAALTEAEEEEHMAAVLEDPRPVKLQLGIPKPPPADGRQQPNLAAVLAERYPPPRQLPGDPNPKLLVWGSDDDTPADDWRLHGGR